MDATRILLQIRNEQERQKQDLADIKNTLGVLGGREKVSRQVEAEKQHRRFHDHRGIKALQRFHADKSGKADCGEGDIA